MSKAISAISTLRLWKSGVVVCEYSFSTTSLCWSCQRNYKNPRMWRQVHGDSSVFRKIFHDSTWIVGELMENRLKRHQQTCTCHAVTMWLARWGDGWSIARWSCVSWTSRATYSIALHMLWRQIPDWFCQRYMLSLKIKPCMSSSS